MMVFLFMIMVCIFFGCSDWPAPKPLECKKQAPFSHLGKMSVPLMAKQEPRNKRFLHAQANTFSRLLRRFNS